MSKYYDDYTDRVERIAAIIFDHDHDPPESRPTEEACHAIAKRILVKPHHSQGSAQVLTIQVQGGCVVDVAGLPDGMTYIVDDADVQDVGESSYVMEADDPAQQKRCSKCRNVLDAGTCEICGTFNYPQEAPQSYASDSMGADDFLVMATALRDRAERLEQRCDRLGEEINRINVFCEDQIKINKSILTNLDDARTADSELSCSINAVGGLCDTLRSDIGAACSEILDNQNRIVDLERASC